VVLTRKRRCAQEKVTTLQRAEALIVVRSNPINHSSFDSSNLLFLFQKPLDLSDALAGVRNRYFSESATGIGSPFVPPERGILWIQEFREVVNLRRISSRSG
jgi:hypothetical protein